VPLESDSMMSRRPLAAAWALSLAFVLFRVWFIGTVQLAPDEAYYWEWSRHLDWSYYDQGPMLAWVIRAGTMLLGANEWGVRFGAVLAGLGISASYIYLAKRLGRPALAPWLVLAANTMLLFAVGGVLMMHDSLAGLFWCLVLVAAVRAIEDDGRWWVLAGLAGGAGVLSKYTAVLLMPCLLLACLSHPGLRVHLKRPWFWLGLVLGGSLAGYPILHWNIQQGWPSLKHVASLGGADGSRVSLVSLPDFLASQFALVTPVLALLILAAWSWAWRLRRQDDASGRLRWLLWCVSAPVFALFLALSLRSRVEGNWPAPAYVAALPLALWRLAELDLLGSRLLRRAVAVAGVLMVLVFSQATWGWIPLPAAHAPKLDGTYRLQGWRELSQRVAAERAGLGPRAFVGCRTYQNAAELGFYLPDHAQPLILQGGLINHQYRFWNQPQAFLGRDAVLVVGQAWELDEMRAMFAHIEPLAPFSSSRHGLLMRTTQLFVGRAFKGIP
jgi:4-amino-4-deoxy-L-arabinose transferase-like glycosyltransferase